MTREPPGRPWPPPPNLDDDEAKVLRTLAVYFRPAWQAMSGLSADRFRAAEFRLLRAGYINERSVLTPKGREALPLLYAKGPPTCSSPP